MPMLAEATDGTWNIEYVEETTDQAWQLELRNLGRFDEVFGRRVLNAFCRCFVHADRLNSVISCIYASEQCHGIDSVAHARDHSTLLWFAVGTLRELAAAIQRLRSALARSGRLDPESDPWVTLRNLERRWENADYLRMRNQVAFHVDEEVIERGLNQLVEDGSDVTLAEGHGPRYVDSRLTLGFLALHNGLDLEPDAVREFIDGVYEDQRAVCKAIQDAFVLAAEAVS